ncbi:helix-turn-helix domain-containing protein [uncultured Methylobacterium sp.]|uniref:helix-turn-helix domain-containing protein n=1 Tax=uncultured Methylobacterium sp. TaxID=157278 RepID=UPI0035CA82AC
MAGLAATAADIRIGALIRAYRRAAGLTQRTVAEAIGVSAAQLQKYEAGTNRISASALQIVADLLDQPIARFFDPRLHGALEDKAEAERDLLCFRGIVALVEAHRGSCIPTCGGAPAEGGASAATEVP